MPSLSVREITSEDISALTRYWTDADPAFLTGMGVDLEKMPKKEDFAKMLAGQLELPYEEKKSYCIIWLVEDKPVGHSNINKIIFGEEGYMHLHLWNAPERKKGAGTAFIHLTLPFFFENCKLQKVYCEPYALNPAPNKTLEKAGFQFVKKYTTTPGWLNFEQEVNLWEMSREQFQKMR